MKLILAGVLLAVVFSFGATTYADAVPLRVGPVSNYGTLGTNGSKVVSLSSGKQVMLRGMSLFWSDATGVPYYNSEVISWAVKNLGLTVFRFAMCIQYYDSDGGTSNALDANYSYMGNPDGDISLLDLMVKTAIENDVYIIVDWHSHRAHNETSSANAFFTKVAQRYAGIPNIIWEVYNEPVNTSWGSIQSYANTVIGSIRNYSQNLAIVGTSNWSQNPQEANSSPVNATNVAYVFHFYAGSHSVGSYGSNITSAMGAGHAVFISEWGTTDANGSGSVSSSETANWISFMESHKISNCNWSLRQASSTLNNTTEASAMFTGSTNLTTQEALSNATYSTSGSIIKNYLSTYSKGAVWEDSLTSGFRSGSCAFAHQSVPETQGSITGVANSSCTYTSSDESVATISGGLITLYKAGYAVMTGNDGTKSVVTATLMPAQTLNFPSYTCRIDTSCSGTKAGNYSGSSSFEKPIDRTITDQGATVTYSSDNPDIISVQQITCTGPSCLAAQKNTKMWIARFISRGTATIHAKGPAVAGYRALDTVVNFYYLKKQQRYNGTYFRDTAVAVNSSTLMLLDTARYEQAAITYAFSPEGLATKNGEYLMAGANDGTILVTATIAETTNYEGQTMTATVVIGTGINVSIEKRLTPTVPFLARVNSQDLVLTLNKSAFVSIQVTNAAGKKMDVSTQRYFPAGEQRISLAGLAQGHYFVRVQQGGISKTFAWSNR